MVEKLVTYDYDKHGGRQRPDWLDKCCGQGETRPSVNPLDMRHGC